MFLEATPSAENGVVLLSRQGLTTSTTVGAGPIRGVFSEPGTFGGDVFTVSGGNLYRGATLLLAIAGTGPVSFAASGLELLVTAGTTLYSYNGTNTVAVTFPDSANVRSIAFISGHFIAVRDGSQKYYWSAQLDGRSWDALDFASAESEPDSLLDALSMRGNLYLMGQSTIEPWFYTGSLDLPFSLIQQRLFPKGVFATGCAVEMDNALFWVGSDGIVYRTSDVPERLSNHGIEERVAASATASAFGFIQEGHSFFCMRLATGTYVYDAATSEWCEFQSYGRVNFAGRCATSQGRTILLGDDATGKIWTFSGYADNDVEMVREFTAAAPIKGGTAVVDSLAVDVSVGHTTLLTGQGSDPVIEMALSRDAGVTWSPWRAAKLGAVGKYRARPRWTRLGMFDSPGAVFKFRVSDPVSVRLSNVLTNEDGGGRSRGA
jgi:hypothetical protein